MSNSDLHTTAIGTGGTSFDTATCIGGKCYYPLIESGNDAKVYVHNMVCTQDQYEKGSLNGTLQTYNATTAPEGTKPDRSPFADDANAYFVGDFNINSMGNGLVSFQRHYATVPQEHTEPYGLYSRTLPSYTIQSVSVADTDVKDLVLKEQYSTDGVNWVTRATTNAGDDVIMATTIDGDSNVTVNDSTLDWKDYSFIRLEYSCTLESSASVFNDTPLNILGDYEESRLRYSSGFTAKLYEEVDSFDADIVINCEHLFGYDTATTIFRDSHLNMGKLTIRSVDSTTTSGEIDIVATTAPFNIAQYHSESNYRDFGGIEIGRHTFFHRAIRHGSIYITYHELVQAPKSASDGVKSLRVPDFTRSSGNEVNCSANIRYRYVRTDSPENILLESADLFPNTLSTTTSPTTQQYLTYVANGTYFNAENEFIERYMGNIFRMGLIKSTLQ